MKNPNVLHNDSALIRSFYADNIRVRKGEFTTSDKEKDKIGGIESGDNQNNIEVDTYESRKFMELLKYNRSILLDRLQSLGLLASFLEAESGTKREPWHHIQKAHRPVRRWVFLFGPLFLKGNRQIRLETRIFSQCALNMTCFSRLSNP